MTAYVLDTNILSLILRNDSIVRERFDQELTYDNLIIGCPVVWYEVRRGLISRDARGQSRIFEHVYSTFAWQDYTQEDWVLATSLWAQRRAQGLPIGDADLLIAVFARRRNAVLVTDNERDFVNLNVNIENWTEPRT